MPDCNIRLGTNYSDRDSVVFFRPLRQISGYYLILGYDYFCLHHI